MTAYFFDASAVVKRYVRERGSAWLRELVLRERPRIFMSWLSGAEVVGAIMRKGRTGEVGPAERNRAIAAFRNEMTRSYGLVPAAPAAIHRAMDLLQEHPLRAYDAVQLASAMSVPRLPDGTLPTFTSADEGLLTVARAVGLPTESPNLHP